MAESFDFPSNAPLVDETRLGTTAWLQVFTRWHRIITSLAQAGPTANRPTQYLWIGRRYFDTSLGANGGKPVWVARVKPSVVWVDASGAVV